MANLPVVIFQFAMSPYADWQRLAWGGALLITFAILVLNIVARGSRQTGVELNQPMTIDATPRLAPAARLRADGVCQSQPPSAACRRPRS